LKFVDNNLVSHVKGVDMEITHEVWAAVTGLKYVGLRINKGNIVWWKISTRFSIMEVV